MPLEVHSIDPVWDASCRVLILGSFPSVKSREEGFFYGHPRNRFWQVMATVLDEEVPHAVEEKRRLLLSHGIAVWDVIASCEIIGSQDGSIRNAVPNDLQTIIAYSPIRHIFTNGSTADALYRRWLQPVYGEARRLPSTSPANAAWSLPRLCEAWRIVRQAAEEV